MKYSIKHEVTLTLDVDELRIFLDDIKDNISDLQSNLLNPKTIELYKRLRGITNGK